MNKRGFTLVELLIVLAILAILIFAVLPLTRDAYGMELLAPVLATDEAVEELAKAVVNDPDQGVVVIIYSATWTANTGGYAKIDKLIAEYRRIMEKLVNFGIANERIHLLLANKGGLEFDGVPIPEVDGIYLYLE